MRGEDNYGPPQRVSSTFPVLLLARAGRVLAQHLDPVNLASQQGRYRECTASEQPPGQVTSGLSSVTRASVHVQIRPGLRPTVTAPG